MDALAPHETPSARESTVRGGSGRRSAATASTLPNLIVIGAMKAGTTSLHHYLGLHPEISMSAVKEPDFFVSELGWKRGLDWYSRQFAPLPVRGESSTSYTKAPRHSGTAERMYALVPDARLVYVVRDPISRIVSHYVHEYAGGREQRPIDQALARDAVEGSDYVAVSSYAMQLERYLEWYDGSRVLVLESEELRDRRRDALARVFAFVGVDPGFWCPEYGAELGTAEQRVRLSPTAYALLRLSARVPSGVRSALPSWARPVKALAARSARPIGRPALDPRIREGLAELLAGDVERLRRLTGMSFEQWSL
jgi:hypothetical protein